MSKTHWKQLINTDYLGAYALKDGEDMVLTIKSVGQEVVTGIGGKKETCTVAHFTENGIKPMILNRTNMKTITKLYKLRACLPLCPAKGRPSGELVSR